MAAAANSKIFSKMKEKNKLQLDIGRGGGSYCCSICGKKLKKFTRRRASENPLSCWQCMILNNNDADS
jgi:hypothetical protein